MSILRYATKNVSLRHTLRKGIRAMERYDISNKKMLGNVKRFAQCVERFDSVCTLFIPARVLKNNRELLKVTDRENVEFGCHGYVHIDYSRLKPQEQQNHLMLSKKIFNGEGLDNIGFRAPYGRYNKALLLNLKSAGFQYDSSSVFLHETLNGLKLDKNTRELIYQRYKSAKTWEPVEKEGILSIPVYLPDDEILVDRMNMSPAAVSRLWKKIATETHKNGGIYVHQLHPIRFGTLKEPLVELLTHSRQLGIEICSLGELAERWRNENGAKEKLSGIICITGDIDAMKISELLR